MPIRFLPMPTDVAHHYQAGGSDAYGLAPERRISDGDGVPCRHCLREVAAGEPYLTLAHRPFPALQPYAETGPIFLHAEACDAHPASAELPPMLTSRDYIVRGYSADDRIVYGTGAVVPTGEIPERAAALLARPDVAYLHIRSARNNCYQCRVERA
ncbi:DUF1203 domain-containing protein [Rhizobium sp. TRM95111]|uniref:DUF1203 domain-containing protein n=1 Tax=Rhizobium alarense TaxID=2846851 RepID=UPI001F3F4939|nr:DUF1203 domain-containing protein [Rhizobium alarense]MCF3640061.1 DUF1203 domain-containing protein [Rhizobium alarense]